jgi:hypothetical protein
MREKRANPALKKKKRRIKRLIVGDNNDDIKPLQD